MKMILLTSALVVATFQARAEGVGNGGFVTNCLEDGARMTKVLDYVEAKDRGIEIDLGPANLNYQQKIDHVLNRFAKMDSMRATMYRQWATEFKFEMKEVGELGPLADTGSVGVPKGCQKPFAVIAQKGVTELFPGDKRYLVIIDEWNKLNDTAKAGLILHELAYRDLLQHGWGNSPNARYLNSIMSSKNFAGNSKMQYIGILQRLGLWTIEQQGVVINTQFNFSVYNEDGSVREAKDPTSGVLAEASAVIGSPIKIKGLEGAVISGAIKQQGWYILARVSFYPNGMITMVELKASKTWKGPNYQCTTKPSDTIMLTSGGLPKVCEGAGRILWNDSWIETSKVRLHDDGSIKSVTFKTPVIETVLGGKRAVKRVGYTKTGELAAAELAEPLKMNIQYQEALVDEVYLFPKTGGIAAFVFRTPLERLELEGHKYTQVDELEFNEKGRIIGIGTPDTCDFTDPVDQQGLLTRLRKKESGRNSCLSTAVFFDGP
jgi:hypothetical protein